ncbi:MAG: cysteine desulfurase [Clostridia bacterium]|nr:cysteine desulfurase [Clostridia bacterium]
MIYFDNAATTKPKQTALSRAQIFLTERFFNPSAMYREGFAIQGEIKQARTALLAPICSTQEFEFIFTSCGTEADNQAIFSFAKRGNAVTTQGEHSAVYSTFQELKNRGVIEPRFAPLQKDGSVDVQKLLDMIDEKTSFVSVNHINNETGAINDINGIAAKVKKKNPRVIFHSDGVQAYGKIPFRLSKDIDLYSVSAHKIGGLKGVGGLIKRKGLVLPPYIIGGGQESGRRSGTENVFGIKQFEYAATEKFATIKEDWARLKELRSFLLAGLDKEIFAPISTENGSPYVTSVYAEGLRGEILLHTLSDKGIIVGTGSACSSNAKHRYSRVILACGYNEKQADGVLRISFCDETTRNDVEEGLEIINSCARELRERMK